MRADEIQHSYEAEKAGDADDDAEESESVVRVIPVQAVLLQGVVPFACCGLFTDKKVCPSFLFPQSEITGGRIDGYFYSAILY